MQTKEIEKKEWQAFFDALSRRHEGTPVGIEILGHEIGAQTQEIGLSLKGITAEWDDLFGNTIVIMVGASADDHITHFIRRPTQVSLEQTDDGGDFALAIRGLDGSTALLRF